MFDTNKDIGESLEPKKAGGKLKLILIIGGVAILIVAIIVIIVLLTKGKKEEKNNNNIDTKLSTISLPNDIKIDDGHYLFDGNIFICYKRDNNKNFTYFGVISDDGSNFKELYGAVFNVPEKANGIRLYVLYLLEIIKEYI